MRTGFVFFIMGWMMAPLSLAAKPVSDIVVHGDIRQSADEIKEIMALQEGEEFTPEKRDQSLNNLRRWGVFNEIDLQIETQPDSVAVHLYLTDAVLVGEINLVRNFPFLDSQVRRFLTIKPGDLYTRARAEGDIEKIIRFYKREGYFNTTVSMEEKWEPVTKDVQITYYINKGSRLRLRTIEMNGNDHLPRGRIVHAVNPYRTYNERRLREAAEKLRNIYREKGFPRALIRIETMARDLEKRRADIRVDVKEGPHVRVRFQGVTKVPVSRLKKTITLFKAGTYDTFELENTQNEMMALYRRFGYPNARITFKLSRLPDKNLDLLFTIDEGKRQIVRTIAIDGNEKISDRKLKNQMLTRPLSTTHRGGLNPEELQEDVRALEAYYQSQGFLSADVQEARVEQDPRFDDQLRITIPVKEEGQTMVAGLIISGNRIPAKKTLLKLMSLKLNRPFDPVELERDKQRVLTYYTDHGYPYAEVFQEVRQTPYGVILHYDIQMNQLVTIGQVAITGDSLTSQRSIRNSMSIRSGHPYSAKKILDSQLGLRRTGAFRSVIIDTIGLDEKREVVHLVVKVEEEKPFNTDFEFGYSREDGISGGVFFSNTNSFGWAKTTSLRLTGGQDKSRAELKWLDPRFVGQDLQLTALTWLQYEDASTFNFLQAGERVGLSRLYHRTSFLVSHELNRNYFVEGSAADADKRSLRDNTISQIALSGNFDNRNSFADPTRGVLVGSSFGIFNEIRGQQANFFKFNETLGHYLTFWKRITLANDFRVGYLRPVGHNVSVPKQELFFMGGAKTLRGFAEDSLGPIDANGAHTGGRLRFIYNSELRFKLIDSFKLGLFHDLGSLTNTLNEIGPDTLRNSMGLGLLYLTPVGPFRADYGFVLDRKPGEAKSRFHFAFGYVF